jgi:hypothetical protein
VATLALSCSGSQLPHLCPQHLLLCTNWAALLQGVAAGELGPLVWAPFKAIQQQLAQHMTSSTLNLEQVGQGGLVSGVRGLSVRELSVATAQ